MKTNHFLLVSFFLLFITTLTACSGSVIAGVNADPTSTPPDQDAPEMANEDVPAPSAVITDPDGSTLANEARVTSGDNFNRGLYERPFSAEGMLYQPDLDILQATIASDENFFYFTLTLKGVSESTKTLTGIYGIEFDRSKTGRGDLLVTVQNVTENWSKENIQVFIDPDKDIGGPNPILADEDFEGDGYESQIELEDSELAYASMLPGHSNIIQIAFSRDLLENANEFLWGAWADKGVNDPGAFDYNDRFNAEQAGSPLKDDANYPLAALFNVDNTCRQPFGFTPQSNIPGSCMVIPQATASETEGNGKSPFCCPTINIGGCCSFPESCGPDDAPPPPPPPDEDEEDDEPAAPAEPVECTPRQSAQPGECDLELEAQVECDGVNDIILISTTGAGFTALTGSSPDFTCSTADDTLTCTGAKQDAGTPLTVEVCGSIVPDRVPNCKDYPDTFWVENLGICLPLGSSCCQIGQEWLADEARCVPIVSGDGDANQEICGDAYVLVNGYCVFKSSLDTCCTNVEIEAPCCYFACVPGYVLDPVTRCCNKAPAPAPQEAPKPKDDPCAGVVCDRCCIAHNCPSGCCSCRQ